MKIKSFSTLLLCFVFILCIFAGCRKHMEEYFMTSSQLESALNPSQTSSVASELGPDLSNEEEYSNVDNGSEGPAYDSKLPADAPIDETSSAPSGKEPEKGGIISGIVSWFENLFGNKDNKDDKSSSSVDDTISEGQKLPTNPPEDVDDTIEDDSTPTSTSKPTTTTSTPTTTTSKPTTTTSTPTTTTSKPTTTTSTPTTTTSEPTGGQTSSEDKTPSEDATSTTTTSQKDITTKLPDGVIDIIV